MSDYIKYQHVERLGNKAVEGILNSKCFVFPKLDGTNCQIWCDENGIIRYGSRNMELNGDADQRGFKEYCSNHPQLLALVNELRQYRIYGEWLVPHTFKDYVKTAWNRYYIFDAVHKKTGMHLPYHMLLNACQRAGYMDYIPVIKSGLFNVEQLEEFVRSNKFMVTGERHGEGIVIKNYDFVNKYGRQVWAKLLSEEFAAKRMNKKQRKAMLRNHNVEFAIVDAFLTPEIPEKIYAQICARDDGWENKKVGELLGRVWYDFINECLFDAVKKHNNPRIDFKELNRQVIMRVKELKKELF